MNNKPIWTCSACGKTIDDPPATSQMPHCECGAYSWYSFPSNDGIRDTMHQRLKELETENKRLWSAIELAADDEVFFNRREDGTIVPLVLLNDLFYYAADCEYIEWDAIPELLERYKKEGWPATVAWAREKRQINPLPKTDEAISRWEELRSKLKELEDERDYWGPQFFTDLADALGMDKESSLDSMMRVVKDMKYHLERLVHTENTASGTNTWDIYEAQRDANKFLNQLWVKGKQC